MKKCTGPCGLEKDSDCFGKDKQKSDGLTSRCKECRLKYRKEHKEEINAYMKSYYQMTADEQKAYSIQYRKEHPDWVKDSNERYRKENEEYLKEYAKQYYKNHQKEAQEYQKEYSKIHKDEIRIYKGIYAYDKYQNDIQFRIASVLRARLYCAIKIGQKAGSAVSDIGCTIEELIEYFKPLFLLQPPNPETGEMMSWVNYGEWHIDHIKPLVSFDLTDREQFLKACNFLNLQPLWAKDNLSKGAKYKDSTEDLEKTEESVAEELTTNKIKES